MEMRHVYVPEDVRGRGPAARLVTHTHTHTHIHTLIHTHSLLTPTPPPPNSPCPPPQLTGQVDKAFDLAAFYHYAVRPSCTYVSDTYLPRCSWRRLVELVDYTCDSPTKP